MPFEGRIDWKELTDTLRTVNYNGIWLYELGFDAPDSMPRERNLTCADFALNAEKIFG